MKYPINLFVISLIAPVLSVVFSCSRSTEPGDPYAFPGPIDAVATNITLTVYSDGWGTILDTIEIETEGPVTIDIEEEGPYYDPPQYYIYAASEGFYTELYYCQKGETISVDLDGVPQHLNSITGVIFGLQTYFADCYFSGKSIALSIPGGTSITTTTDGQGRYGFGNLSEEIYILHFTDYGVPHSFEIVNTDGTDYNDLSFLEANIARAPNIYLYPESTTNVRIELGFPFGGQIVESKPYYDNGWDINVTPDGMINEQYEYLFYEVLMSTPLNHRAGWLLDGSSFEGELRGLLSSRGFVGREIDDFVEYWVPRLEGSPWYAVYPQDAESMITLDISPRPDNILRALFLIRPLAYQVSIPAPPDQGTFVRKGFTVIEWGVIGPIE